METLKERPISVIVPTLNRGDLLEKCVKGLSQQHYSNFEVIILNDGGKGINTSTPAFIDLQDLITPDRVIVVNSDQRIGSAFQRNKGVMMSQGELMAFTDDDAIPGQDWLKSINEYFERHPQVAAMNGRIEAVSLETSSERIRQAYYDYKHAVHATAILDDQYKRRYNIETEETNLADWLGLGNATLNVAKFREVSNLFDGSMKLNYGPKLARSLMRNGLLVTYSPYPVVFHHHERSMDHIFRTRIENGRNFCRLDNEVGKTLGERWSDLFRYIGHVYPNHNLIITDLLSEALYSEAFVRGYTLELSTFLLKLPKYLLRLPKYAHS